METPIHIHAWRVVPGGGSECGTCQLTAGRPDNPTAVIACVRSAAKCTPVTMPAPSGEQWATRLKNGVIDE